MMVTQMIWRAGPMLAALALMAPPASVVAAQPRARSSAAAGDSSQADRQTAAHLRAFREMGIAAKLNTTPEALTAAYEQARRTNGRLNRGQFIAANVVAANLGEDNPRITTPALLSGLRNGRSLGQTLQSLGLSAHDAKVATQTADHQRHEAEQSARAHRDAARRDAQHHPDGHGHDHR